MSRYEVIEEGGGFTIAFTGRTEGFSEIHSNPEDAEKALTEYVAWRDVTIFGARANSRASMMGQMIADAGRLANNYSRRSASSNLPRTATNAASAQVMKP